MKASLPSSPAWKPLFLLQTATLLVEKAKWSDYWPYAHTYYGLAAAGITVLIALYRGPKALIETHYWYCALLWDNDVLSVIEQRKMTQAEGTVILGIPLTMIENPFTAKEIAERLGRKESSVQKSLQRLKRQRKAEVYQSGWRVRS